MFRWIGRLLSWFLGWPLLLVVSLIASLLFHLDTGLGKKLGLQLLNEFVSGEMVGTLHAGEITQLRLWHIIVKDTYVYDPDGNPIIYGETVELGIDPLTALRGRLRFYYAHLTKGWVHLIDDGEGSPTFLAAFDAYYPTAAAAAASAETEGLYAYVENMDLREVDLYGELLGLKDLRVDGMHVRGRMEFTDITEIEVWSATGKIVKPFPFEADLDKIVGTIYTDVRGVQILAEASLGEQKVAANVVYRPPEGGTVDDPYDLNLFVRAEPVNAETLRDVGFEWADSLKGDIRGWVRIWGPPEEYRLRADLQTAGGQVRVQGTLPEKGATRIEVMTTKARVGRLINGAPDIVVGGRVTFVTDPKDEDILWVDLDVGGFEYDTFSVPAFRAKTKLRPDGIDLIWAETQYAGGQLYLDGNVEFRGTMAIHAYGTIPQVGSDPNFQEYAPGIRGRAQFDLMIRQSMGGDFGVAGWVSLGNFDYGAINASQLRLEGAVSGNPRQPVLDLILKAQDLRVAGYEVGRGETKLQGGPNQYEADGLFAALDRRRAEFTARVEVEDGTYRLNVDSVEITARDRSWRGSVDNAVLDPNTGITFERVLMGQGSERLEAQGVWRFDGEDDITADLHNFDLAVLQILYPDRAPEASGSVDLHFELRGDLDSDPRVVAEGTLTDADLYEISPINAAYLIRYDGGTLDADAQVRLGPHGNYSLSATGILETGTGDARTAFMNGIYEITFNAGQMDLTLLQRLVPEPADFPSVRGFADVGVKMFGAIDAPSFEGSIEIPELTIEDWPTYDVRTQFSYEYGALSARLTVANEGGQLIDTEGSLLVDLVNLGRHPRQAIETLDVSPWRFSLRIPPRLLSDFPPQLTSVFPNPQLLQFAASLTLAGGGFKTKGDLYASFDWRVQDGSGLCGSDASPRGTLKAALQDDRTQATFDVLLGRKRAVRMEASAETPLDDWLQAAKPPALPVTDLSASFEDAPTDSIPYLCLYAAGPLSADLDVKGLFGSRPELDLSIEATELRARRREPATRVGTVTTIVETPPASNRITASYRDGLAKLHADMQWWNGGSTEIKAQVPLIWNRKHLVPIPGKRGDVEGEANFDRMPLQAVLAWMAGVVNVQGILAGSVTAQGSIKEPKFVGSVQLSDGKVDVRSVGQTLENVSGRAIFDEDGVAIDSLTATDSKGNAVVEGRVGLRGLTPKEIDFVVDAKRFPLRQEGIIKARMDGNLRLTAEFLKEELDGKVLIRKLDLDLPQSSRTPQDLAPHPDIYFIGEEYEPERTDVYTVKLHFVSENRFWIRSRDQNFAAQASADLWLVLDKKLKVTGTVTLHGGHFEVFGKRFEVQSASMIFDGDPDLDAKVELVATHQLRGTADSVSVRVSGRFSDPDIEFTSTRETESEGEVIALLVTGTTRQERGINTSTAEAGQEATDFLSGVAAGIFSGTLRSEFGGLAPTFGVQSGTEDTDTQVQVGFNVDALIPRDVQSVVRGLYVEGQFVARGSETNRNTTGQAQRPGFLVEALWPLNFVTTGTFAPPSNWSIDVTWEP